MADRRMVARAVVSTDAFLDMPLSAQALYMHMTLETDDEGFVASPRAVCRLVGAAPADLEELVARGYLIRFESGVVLVRHFYAANTVRSDRARASRCAAERALVALDGNDVWQLASERADECGEDMPSSETVADNCQPTDNQVADNCKPTDNQVADNCQPTDNQVATTCGGDGCEVTAQVNRREDKGREKNKDKGARARTRPRFVAPTVGEVEEFAKEAGIAIDAGRFVDYYASKGWLVGKAPMRDWQAAARNWSRRNAPAVSQQPSQLSQRFGEYD